MKILQIDEMKNCGHFKDFRWPRGIDRFEKVNLIYGPNGAGKSSLSRAFEFVDDDPSDNKRLTLRVNDGSGAERQISSSADNEFFEHIFVYSDRYVEKGHSFRLNPTLDFVLTVGERSVKEEAELAEIEEDLNTKEPEFGLLIEEKKDIQNRIKGIYAAVSDVVVSAVSGAGGRWKSKSSYNVRKVESALEEEDTRWRTLGNDEIEEKTLLTRSPKAGIIELPLIGGVDVEGLLLRLRNLLSEVPFQKMLDSLTDHPEAGPWVQEGLGLHRDMDSCIFCAQPLTEERKRDIAMHFSDEVEKLQENLHAVIDELTETKNRYSAAVNGLPDSRILAEHLQKSYRLERQNLEEQLADLNTALDANISVAKRKLENVLKVVDELPVELPIFDISSVLKCIREHNNFAEDHERLVQNAAQDVEMHHLKLNFPKVQELKKKLQECVSRESELSDEIEKLTKSRDRLLNREGDPLPAAETMTARVAEILGRNELKFEFTPDRARYLVTRNGEKAEGLSTGERSVVMLVYFIEQVARAGQAEKPIVVIDDPVSSMDANVFMGISTYIWSRMVTDELVDQMFLLTHNFELFRQWDIQLQGAQRFVKHKLYEICSARRDHGDGISRRSPSLRDWPPSPIARKKTRSSYHHLFISVAEAKKALEHDDSLDRLLDAQLLFPNAMRRLLETFLAFRFPEAVGNFTGSMRCAADQITQSNYDGDADALRLMLTRYTHTYSHSDTPESSGIIQPDEVRTAMAAVFTFMDILDPKHFEGMCSVLELDRQELLSGL